MPVSFRRLRISGFKSFAEPASMEILPGLTGIVGPNGCGKSNVVEALRWAMGESSARSLRGGEMEDVIFAGTAGRASRNIAEVTLFLDEAAGRAPPPFHEQAELEIGRRIERGSGSRLPHQRQGGPSPRRADPVRRSGLGRARLRDGQPGPRRRSGRRQAGGPPHGAGRSRQYHRPACPPPRGGTEAAGGRGESGPRRGSARPTRKPARQPEAPGPPGQPLSQHLRCDPGGRGGATGAAACPRGADPRPGGGGLARRRNRGRRRRPMPRPAASRACRRGRPPRCPRCGKPKPNARTVLERHRVSQEQIAGEEAAARVALGEAAAADRPASAGSGARRSVAARCRRGRTAAGRGSNHAWPRPTRATRTRRGRRRRDASRPPMRSGSPKPRPTAPPRPPPKPMRVRKRPRSFWPQAEHRANRLNEQAQTVGQEREQVAAQQVDPALIAPGDGEQAAEAEAALTAARAAVEQAEHDARRGGGRAGRSPRTSRPTAELGPRPPRGRGPGARRSAGGEGRRALAADDRLADRRRTGWKPRLARRSGEELTSALNPARRGTGANCRRSTRPRRCRRARSRCPHLCRGRPRSARALSQIGLVERPRKSSRHQSKLQPGPDAGVPRRGDLAVGRLYHSRRHADPSRGAAAAAQPADRAAQPDWQRREQEAATERGAARGGGNCLAGGRDRRTERPQRRGGRGAAARARARRASSSLRNQARHSDRSAGRGRRPAGANHSGTR